MTSPQWIQTTKYILELLVETWRASQDNRMVVGDHGVPVSMVTQVSQIKMVETGVPFSVVTQVSQKQMVAQRKR